MATVNIIFPAHYGSSNGPELKKNHSFRYPLILFNACFPITQPLVAIYYSTDIHQRRDNPFEHRTPLSSRPPRQLILVILGICQNCLVRTKETTTEVILFEYSRQSVAHCRNIYSHFCSTTPSISSPLFYLFTIRVAAAVSIQLSWQPRGREKPWTEIMLWATPKGPPRALQTSECHELLDPTKASCLILA